MNSRRHAKTESRVTANPLGGIVSETHALRNAGNEQRKTGPRHPRLVHELATPRFGARREEGSSTRR